MALVVIRKTTQNSHNLSAAEFQSLFERVYVITDLINLLQISHPNNSSFAARRF